MALGEVAGLVRAERAAYRKKHGRDPPAAPDWVPWYVPEAPEEQDPEKG